jgi:hypothetical protein
MMQNGRGRREYVSVPCRGGAAGIKRACRVDQRGGTYLGEQAIANNGAETIDQIGSLRAAELDVERGGFAEGKGVTFAG